MSLFIPLQRIFKLIYFLWINLFNYLLLYPLLGILQREKIFDIHFLNFGYVEDDEEENKKNSQSNSPSKLVQSVGNFPKGVEGDALRAHCLLYEKTLEQCPLYESLNGLQLLEVGCGPGGGLNWIKVAHPEIGPLYGLDRHPPPSDSLPLGVNVISGRAEKLPFADCSFDILLNVESSHCYGEGEKAFFHEVSRVLKKGGYLCWTDIRTSKGAPFWIKIFGNNFRKVFAPNREKLENGEHLYMIGCWEKI
uniref:Methyltransf_11 domain-containing protein n=1 Tax=Meloidogyne hapla TaxID=6305 RepID=A0A1I8B6Y4_MELHA